MTTNLPAPITKYDRPIKEGVVPGSKKPIVPQHVKDADAMLLAEKLQMLKDSHLWSLFRVRQQLSGYIGHYMYVTAEGREMHLWPRKGNRPVRWWTNDRGFYDRHQSSVSTDWSEFADAIHTPVPEDPNLLKLAREKRRNAAIE